MSDKKYEDHPFASDYSILKQAFSLFEEKQKKEGVVLAGFKGITSEAWDQYNWEKSRIEEVKILMYKLLEEHLRK